MLQHRPWPPCTHPDWRQRPPHTHYLQTVTAVVEGHRHRLQTFVYSANGSAWDGHIHYFQGVTERVAGHYHRFYDRTGPAIALSDGSHYHTISDVTYYNYRTPPQIIANGAPLQGGVVYYDDTLADRHRHSYATTTSRNFGEPPPGW